MTPIMIMTRDRPHFLDLTLRSLSASDLPDDQELVVFDDGSKDDNTHRYLYSTMEARTGVALPSDNAWNACGLKTVVPRTYAKGLKGSVQVLRVSEESMGVFAATCTAFCWMVRHYGSDRGLVMLQDDVVFNPDWMTRLHSAAASSPHNEPLGLITGAWLGVTNREAAMPMTYVHSRGITAQCFYLTPAGIRAVVNWCALNRHTSLRKTFDNQFCANVRAGGASVYRMHPAVCQHIGITSMVRRSRTWYAAGPQGRVDLTARGPFPLAHTVRRFHTEEQHVEDTGSGATTDGDAVAL